MPTMKMKNVSHPSHYERFRVNFEPADISAKLPHPLASAFEYILRAPYKNGAEDLRKAEWWLNKLLQDKDIWEGDGAIRFHVFPDETVSLLCRIYLCINGNEESPLYALFMLDRFIFGFASGGYGYCLCTRESVQDAIEALQCDAEEETEEEEDE